MSLRAASVRLGRRGLLLVLLAAALLALGLAIGQAGPAPRTDGALAAESVSAGPVSVAMLTETQAQILGEDAVQVRVKARDVASVRLTATARPTGRGTSDEELTVARPRARSLSDGEVQKVPLPLTNDGRRALETCREHRVEVTAEVTFRTASGREAESTARTSEVATLDPQRCDPLGAYDVDTQRKEGRANGTPRSFVATGMGNNRVDVALFACERVRRRSDRFRFTPSDDGDAHPGVGGARITRVNGQAQGGSTDHVRRVTPQNGRVTFETNGSDTCAEPVVFRDILSNAVLDLKDRRDPIEPFGVGGETAFQKIGVTNENANRCDFLDPAVCMFPFPNDHFTKPDSTTASGRRINFHRDSMPKNKEGIPIEPSDYNRNDGYSPGQKIVTKVPGLETQEAFDRTGAVPIYDIERALDPDQPVVVIDADTGRRHLVWAEIDSNPQDRRDVNLIIRPGVNFKEGGRYIVALRNLKNEQGDPIRAQRAFQLYRDRIITSESDIESRRPKMEGIFDTLGEAGIARDDLYVAWDFTVASRRNLTERVLHMRDDAFGRPSVPLPPAGGLGDSNLADMQVDGVAPSFTIEAVKNYTTSEDSRIARRVDGKIKVPCYLDQPGCPAGSRFLLDGNDRPIRNGSFYEAKWRCHIPRSALTGGAPQARVSLYGHGLLGSRSELGQGQLKDFGNEHNIVFCATDWIGMACADLPGTNPESVARDIAQGGSLPNTVDCDIPTILTILKDLSNFPKLADRVQQGLLNFLYLGRAMVHPSGFNNPPVTTAPHQNAFKNDGGDGILDRRRLFYDGNSQGGIIGGALAALGVDHNRAVLGVPGMNYSTLLRRSVDFDSYAEGNFEGIETDAGLYDSYPNELERPMIISMMQMLWDRAEANGYAHHMTDDPLPNTPAHKVMLHVGFGDHQVADVTTEVEARTINARVHTPVLDPDRPRYRGRPPEEKAKSFFDIPPIQYQSGGPHPFFDGSALIFWDIGPLQAGNSTGTPPPPPGNVPPRQGTDPHEFPRREAEARLQKSEFLKIDGNVIDVCGGPCYAHNWHGP